MSNLRHYCYYRNNNQVLVGNRIIFKYNIFEVIKMHFKDNLRYLRHSKKDSQNDLAHLLGYKSFTTIQKWEDGTSLPSLSVIKKVAEYYGVTLEAMCNDDLTNQIVNMVQVPILGEVKAGYGLWAQEHISGYELVRESEASYGSYFYLEVVGDSMKNVRIYDGDLVYCRSQSTLEHNEIGVILLENNEVTLKRVHYKEDTMILKPENDTIKELVYTAKEIKEKGITILGKLIHNKIMY